MANKDQLLENAKKANVLKQYREAEDSCSKAIKKENKFISAYLERAKARVGKGELQNAISDLDCVVNLVREIYFSDRPEKFEKRLDKHMRYEFAHQHWNAERKQQIKEIFISALTERSDVKFQLNNFDGAEADIIYVINFLGAHNVVNYDRRFLIRKRLKKYNEALSDMNTCIAIDGGITYQYYMKRAELYILLGDYEAALTDYNNVIFLKISHYPPLPTAVDHYQRACV